MRCPQAFGSSVTLERSVFFSEPRSQCVAFYAGDFTDHLDEEVSRDRKATGQLRGQNVPQAPKHLNLRT